MQLICKYFFPEILIMHIYYRISFPVQSFIFDSFVTQYRSVKISYSWYVMLSVFFMYGLNVAQQ